MHATKLFKSLLRNTSLIFSLLLTIFSLHIHPAQAQNEAAQDLYTGKKEFITSDQEHFIDSPYTIQVSPYLGFTEKIPQLLKPNDITRKEQYLRIVGVSMDVGVLQIRKFLYKQFHCYPKLGLAVDCGWLENNGSLMGCLVYLEPQYDYLARWEVFPRLSIGPVYVSIPRNNFKNLTPAEQEAEKNNSSGAREDFYQQGWQLNLGLALTATIRINPYWHLNPRIGFAYLADLGKKAPPSKDKDLKAIMSSIALSYTPCPNRACYYATSEKAKKSRVDISWLSSFKKPESLSLFNQQGPVIGKNKYGYIGGVYSQWSLQLIGSHAVTLGMEWIWDGAAEQLLKDTVISSPLKVSLLSGHEFRWGKLLFGQQIGYYLMNNCLFHPLLRFYVRLGIDYKLTNFLCIGTSLRAGVVPYINKIDLKTDFIDFRIGYSF